MRTRAKIAGRTTEPCALSFVVVVYKALYNGLAPHENKGKRRTEFLRVWYFPIVPPPLDLSGALALPLPLSVGWTFRAPVLCGLRVVIVVVVMPENEEGVKHTRPVSIRRRGIDFGGW